MTGLIAVRPAWDNILSPTRRFDEEESWIATFPIVDTFEGEVRDPQSFHKYLYTHGNPIGGIDPTGMSELMSTLSGLGAQVGMFATAMSAMNPDLFYYGIVIPFMRDLDMVLFGSSGSDGTERAVAGAFLLFDVLPTGKILKRVFPTQKLGQVVRWTRSLFAEHSQHAPATRRAMAAALQFSEEILEDSVKVAGKGGAGADILAKTVDGRTIGREVSIYQGSLPNLYGKISAEAGQIANDIDVKQVFIQVSDDFLAQPNARQRILEASQNVIQDYRNAGHDLTVIVVDGAANQLFPIRPKSL